MKTEEQVGPSRKRKEGRSILAGKEEHFVSTSSCNRENEEKFFVSDKFS